MLIITGLFFTGCYTTIWMPSQDEGDSNSGDEAQNTMQVQNPDDANYYRLTDYGDYYYYYNRPWWYSAAQASQGAKSNSNNSNAKTVRNNDAGRGDFSRTGSRATTNIPDAPLPSTGAPAPPATSSSASSNSTKNNNGNRTENTSSSNSSSRDKGSNNNQPARNDDGSRKTSGR